MNWALVFLMCTRWCEPQYVELYPTKEACVAKLSPDKFMTTKNIYCVPVAK